ncbi:hypothetical protein FA95DRAFT_712990 [Auriscalpium vulgare]|uniref:Uncharacterized protein n=1 Tax=Auriscalpium vulgare TaxID=40419 RepID=A0ACB8RAY1_9AGAM|nr:hypothetical protein FA95DRAFT_712990 [Auriscalpium vulgare]
MSPSSAWTAGCLSLGSPRVSVMGHGGGMISQFALCMLLKEHDDKLARPPKDLGARRISRVTANMSNLVRSCERLQALVQDDTSVRRSLINHVRLLVRDTQNRLAESVAILKDYAELYSADLSDEIKSRAAAHHQLDNRLQRASTLRCAVVDLGDSFELNVLQPWKGVRAAGDLHHARAPSCY